MAGQIKKVKKGDPIFAEDYNALVDEVLRLGRLNVSPPLVKHDTPAGITLSANVAPWIAVKITGVISGQVGRYNAKSILLGPNTAATGALTEANLGTTASAADTIVWHSPEIKIASAKHMLIADAIYLGRLVGVNSSGKRVVLLGVLPVGETASATTLGAASEGSESADSTTWSRATNGTPVSVYIQTRTAYYHAGDEKLYGYFRLFTYDACGILLSIGAETRVEIDAPEDC